ncbi:MAG: AAA family ATPase, partial [Chloroflexota bacterium]
MLHRVECWHYKCLKRIDVELGAINILVGPNASGKSTLLDVFDFLRDALEKDVETAVRQRGTALREIVWNQADKKSGFELALEMAIPHNFRHSSNSYDRLRYEVGVGLNFEGTLVVNGENLWLIDSSQSIAPRFIPQRTLFPLEPDDAKRVVRPAGS